MTTERRRTAPGTDLVGARHRRPARVAAILLALLAAAALMVTARAAAAAGSSPVTASNTAADGRALSFRDAVILGVVEGVTEYLPVSSTGHLLLTEHLLGITGDAELTAAADSYAIAIQLGAILAVVLLYWRRLRSIVKGILGRDQEGRHLAIVLLASFLPAVVIALIGEKFIKGYLFALWPVTAAWLVGGVVILLVARHDRATNHSPEDGDQMADLTVGRAVAIGLLQCVAMWPGVSRSLVTLLGGRLVGLSTIAAVEYSFLLGLITLGAATVYEGVSEGAAIIHTFGIVTPIVGVIAAFVAAALAVEWMVSYLHRHTLAIFGWYRLALSAVVTLLLVTAVL
jgi:undecaprenyl-diphosphatase